MNNIKKYNEYFEIKDCLYTKNLIESYIKDEITLEQFEIDFISINEGLGENIKDKLFSILKYVADKVLILGEKTIGLLNTVVKLAKKFIKSNPKLFKVIVIIIILLLVSAATAMASTTKNPSEVENILQAAVGMLEHMKDGFEAGKDTNLKVDYFDVNGAQKALLLVKEKVVGSIYDNEELRKYCSEKSIELAQKTLHLTLKLVDNKENSVSDTNNLDIFWKSAKDMFIEYSNGIGNYKVVRPI